MKFLASITCAVLAVVVLAASNHAAAGMTGPEKLVTVISGSIISGVFFLGFIIFSITGLMDGPERCDECRRFTDSRLAYSEEPNTKNPPCGQCKRPLPESQYNN